MGSDGGRPPNSNVVNEQSSTMDAHYMQNNSQVFVFYTQLANKSAESVMSGQCKSIIEYHCNQPDTKIYLMRNPLKVNQFNRQNSAQWMNNIPQAKQRSASGSNKCGSSKANFRNNPMMSADMLNHGRGPPQSGMNVPRQPMWNQQGNMNPPPQMCGNNMMPGVPGPGSMQSPMNPGMGPANPSGMMHGNMHHPPHPSSMDMMSDSNNPNPLMSNSVLPSGSALGNFSDDQYPLSPQTQLKGMKVPDENLTPSQRIQREDKLAHLERIKKFLMPLDSQQQSGSHHPMNADIPPSTHHLDDISAVLTADSNGSAGSLLGDLNDGSMQRTTNAGPGGPNGGTQMLAADWQGLPSFYDEHGKRVPDLGGSNMNRCASRSQGPPPPYHQTTRSASVPIAGTSPNPNSPGNGTSNLSLPSPRACSGINSPAASKQQQQQQRPGPSPTPNQINTNNESPGQPSLGRTGVNISNPGTPVSSGTHLSPNSKQKAEGKMCTGPMSSEFSPAASGQQSPDGIYSRSLQSLARQQQQKQQPPLLHAQTMPSANSHCKEPPLMPVPSPQHIQYLPTFDVQELIIQKQPNTSLKDTPSLSQAGLDTVIPVSTDNSCSKGTVSGPNTPSMPSSVDMASSKYAGPPGDFGSLSPGGDLKPQLLGNIPSQVKNDGRFSSCNSPQMMDQQQRFQAQSANFMSQNNKKNFLDTLSPEKTSSNMGGDSSKEAAVNFPLGMMPNNVPIDPSVAPKAPSFDPISSLAQMSQQLTNNTSGPPCGQPGMMHPNMMAYHSNGRPGHMGPDNMNMMQMNEMAMCGNPNNESPMQFNSPIPAGMNPMGMANVGGGGGRMMCPSNMDTGGTPKPGNMQGPYPAMMAGNPGPGPSPPQRIMRPPGPGSYNNANVQVKASAPNTIQYLPNPNRTQMGMGGAPGQLCVEFLRYQNPNSMAQNMDKMQQQQQQQQQPQPQQGPPHNMNYFQGNYQGGPPPGPNMMGNMSCGMPPGNPMVRPGMRPYIPPNMMRMGMGGGGMVPYNEHQIYAGPGGGGPNANMSNNNCHMFMPNAGGGSGGPGPSPGGPKMMPMGMGGNMAPDAAQLLHPSLGQPNNFKGSPSFMGQSDQTPEMMSDPQYRQQFHNFQQQLYATNIRGQMGNQPMPGGPNPNQQYFLPK